MALTKVKLIADGVITSANLDASHGITTSDIGEGSNLYYTDSRVSSYLSTNGFATQTDIVAAITDSAPVTLDTLNELAAALGDDPNFATTTATSLGLKAPLASPSFTGNATFAGNVTVGTGIIKPSIGGDIAITQGAIGLRINDAASAISPTTATSNNDNAVDLGVSNIRFKDLYLGGSITSGGNATFAGFVKAPFFTTDGGRGFKQDSVAFVGTYSNGNDANGANDLGSTTNQWRDIYISGDITSSAGGATFAGNITFGDSHFIGDDADDNLLIQSSANENIIINSVDDLFLRTGGTTKLIVKNGGNVGIGETSPDVKLHIVTSDQSIAKFESSNSDGPYTEYYQGSTPLGFIGNAQGLANAGSTNMCVRGQSELVFAISSSERMRIGSNGYVGMGIANTNNQRITLAEADSNGSHIKMNNSRTGGGYWVNGVGDNGSNASIVSPGGIFWYNGTTRMVIDNSGDIGIGTASPSTRLHVSADFDPDDALGYVHIENTDTTPGSSLTNSALTVKNYHGTSQFMQWENNGLRIGSRILTNSGVGDVVVTAGTDSEKLRITADGEMKFMHSNHRFIRWYYGNSAFSNPFITIISNATSAGTYSQISVKITMFGRGVSANSSQWTEAMCTVDFTSDSGGTMQNLTQATISHTTLGNSRSAGTFSISGNSLGFTPNRQTNYDNYAIEANITFRSATFDY